MIGQVVRIAGAQMSVALERTAAADPIRVGAIVKVFDGERQVVGSVSQVSAEPGQRTEHLIVAELLGELTAGDDGTLHFSRGVSIHPVPGEPVVRATD